MSKENVLFSIFCGFLFVSGSTLISKFRNRKKLRLKINDDTMTTVVVFSLAFCVLVIVWGMLLASKGLDSSAIVSSALTLFGTELGICGLMKVHDRTVSAEDRRIEIRLAKRTEERTKKEKMEKESWLNKEACSDDEGKGSC